MFTRLGQTDQPTASQDPIDALAACVNAPASCTNYTTVLVNLTSVKPDVRVLDLISRGMATGSQDGANPFYASAMAVDLMRLHADADPDAATDLLIQATQALLQDADGSQAAQGKDGFFSHVIDGLTARLLISSISVPPDLRVRVIELLQTLASSTMLPDTAQRAQAALKEIGAFPEPVPYAVPVAPMAPAPVPAVPTTTAAAPAKKFSALQISAIAIGLGAIVLGGAALLLSRLKRSPSPAALSAGPLRRRVEAGLRRKADRASDL